MNRLSLVIACFVALVLSSCFSRMKITVDIFDRDAIVQSKEYQERLLQDVSTFLNTKGSTASLHKLETQVAQQFGDFIDSFNNKKYYKNGKQVIIDIRSISPIKTDFNGKLSSLVNNADSLFSLARNLREATVNNTSVVDRQRILGLVRAGQCELNAISELPEKLILAFTEGLSEYRGDEENLVRKRKTEKQRQKIQANQLASKTQEIVSEVASGMFGQSITNDVMASLVARSPETYWHRYNYTQKLNASDVDDVKRDMRSKQKSRVNRVAVSAFFGNTDVAVKMIEPGVFVLKGVRMDADEAIKAGARVANLATKYIAGTSLLQQGQALPEDLGLGDIELPSVNPQELQNMLTEYQYHAKQIHRKYLGQISSLHKDLKPKPDKEKLTAINDLLKAYKNELQQLKETYTP